MHSPVLPLPPSRYSTFLSSRVLLFSSRHPTAMLSCFLSFLSFLPPSVLSFWFLMWFCLLKGANSFPCTCSVVDVMECVQRLCVHIHAEMQEIHPFKLRICTQGNIFWAGPSIWLRVSWCYCWVREKTPSSNMRHTKKHLV